MKRQERCTAGLVEGKVALITGAARGQGRSHAVRLAEEGASIIAVDICAQYDTVPYEMSSSADLEETVRLVESQDRPIIARVADVRIPGELEAAVRAGLSEFGQIDIVCADAGISIAEVDRPTWKISTERWRDTIDTNLTGAWNTVKAAVPSMVSRRKGRLHRYHVLGVWDQGE